MKLNNSNAGGDDGGADGCDGDGSDGGGSLEQVAAGWGNQADWHEVTFDLNAYEGQDVLIRFAFDLSPLLPKISGKQPLFARSQPSII